MNKNEESLPYYKYISKKIYWKDSKPYWIKNNKIAGSLNVKRYRHFHIKINNKSKHLLAHRVRWFMYYGEMPPKIIDHINRVKDDNRIENLRSINASNNTINSNKQTNTSSKYKGVHKVNNRWQVRIQINGKRKSLKYFNCEHCAGLAYDNALIKYGLSEYGNFNLLKGER